ncbi:hypothetical protein DZA28_18010 [Pseudomonas alloputida]|jgi:hypothetical protein|uniref:Transposase n=1 Tax=Pseudomonas alloputida TaxID=1940621 RepID=A0ABY3D7Z5_9PSED|nr:hypothetical protein DZA28_18010 [Pseudomonas alloputida]
MPGQRYCQIMFQRIQLLVGDALIMLPEQSDSRRRALMSRFNLVKGLSRKLNNHRVVEYWLVLRRWQASEPSILGYRSLMAFYLSA